MGTNLAIWGLNSCLRMFSQERRDIFWPKNPTFFYFLAQQNISYELPQILPEPFRDRCRKALLPLLIQNGGQYLSHAFFDNIFELVVVKLLLNWNR